MKMGFLFVSDARWADLGAQGTTVCRDKVLLAQRPDNQVIKISWRQAKLAEDVGRMQHQELDKCHLQLFRQCIQATEMIEITNT
jgi:hypothetical protein